VEPTYVCPDCGVGMSDVPGTCGDCGADLVAIDSIDDDAEKADRYNDDELDEDEDEFGDIEDAKAAF